MRAENLTFCALATRPIACLVTVAINVNGTENVIRQMRSFRTLSVSKYGVIYLRDLHGICLFNPG